MGTAPSSLCFVRMRGEARKARSTLAYSTTQRPWLPFPSVLMPRESEPTHPGLLRQAFIYTPTLSSLLQLHSQTSVGHKKQAGVNKPWQGFRPPNRCPQARLLLPNTTNTQGSGRLIPSQMFCRQKCPSPAHPSRDAGEKPLFLIH